MDWEGSARTTFLGFIDRRKAYDSVDSRLICQVLARFGVQLDIIEVIRQFHDGIRACVQNDTVYTRNHLSWHSGFVKGFLAPLLLNAFFVALRLVALEISSKNADIVEGLTRLNSSRERLAMIRH